MTSYKRIRSGMGLGDSLYLQAVARHLVNRGEAIEVCTAWPDVFRYLDVRIAKFSRKNIDYLAHYTTRKIVKGTSQFDDCCINAGIKDRVEFRLDWEIVNRELTDSLQSHGKPVLAIQLPRVPMGRTDGFGKEILPKCEPTQRLIDAVRDDYHVIQIGSGKPLFEYKGLHEDFRDKTSVTDLIDIACVMDRLVGYCSFTVPLCESLDKPAMFVWSNDNLITNNAFIRSIRPGKILHKKSSQFVVDNDPNIDERLREFCR